MMEKLSKNTQLNFNSSRRRSSFFFLFAFVIFHCLHSCFYLLSLSHNFHAVRYSFIMFDESPTGHKDKKVREREREYNLFATFPVMMIKNYLVRTMKMKIFLFYFHFLCLTMRMKNRKKSSRDVVSLWKFILNKNVVFMWIFSWSMCTIQF